jgi:BirA family biotin operon repressor/biotin-[acetyl-CoA-carboxylase] ligase
LKIYYYELLDSTQIFLIDGLSKSTFTAPVAIVAREQTHGRGSRENSWISGEGNLFVSFAIEKSSLPEDLKLESTSIYLSMILKEQLTALGSSVWLKWPNDFYCKELKIGGTITTVYKELIVCGIGMNLNSSPKDAGKLDVDVTIDELLHQYFDLLKSCPSWKQIFSKFELEFGKSRRYFTHIRGEKVSLEAVTLQCDGSIDYHGEKVYSLR